MHSSIVNGNKIKLNAMLFNDTDFSRTLCLGIGPNLPPLFLDFPTRNRRVPIATHEDIRGGAPIETAHAVGAGVGNVAVRRINGFSSARGGRK